MHEAGAEHPHSYRCHFYEDPSEVKQSFSFFYPSVGFGPCPLGMCSKVSGRLPYLKPLRFQCGLHPSTGLRASEAMLFVLCRGGRDGQGAHRRTRLVCRNHSRTEVQYDNARTASLSSRTNSVRVLCRFAAGPILLVEAEARARALLLEAVTYGSARRGSLSHRPQVFRGPQVSRRTRGVPAERPKRHPLRRRVALPRWFHEPSRHR